MFRCAHINFFLIQGMTTSCVGPTLPALTINLQLNVDDLWFIIPAREVGYMCGCFASEFLYKCVY